MLLTCGCCRDGGWERARLQRTAATRQDQRPAGRQPSGQPERQQPPHAELPAAGYPRSQPEFQQNHSPEASPSPQDFQAAVVAGGTQSTRAERRALAIPPAGHGCREVQGCVCTGETSVLQAFRASAAFDRGGESGCRQRQQAAAAAGHHCAPRDGADGAAAASRASPASRLRRASSGCCSWRAALQATGCRGRPLLLAAATNGLAWLITAVDILKTVSVWWAGRDGGEAGAGGNTRANCLSR